VPLVETPNGNVIIDPNVQQAGSCKCQTTAAPGDTGPLPPVSPVDAGDNYYSGNCGCGGSCCVPGHKCCHCDCDTSTWYGRLWCGFYECICCEDHCYEGGWNYLADSAFWIDGARPITSFTLAYEHGEHLPTPDRADYFLAQTGSGGVRNPPLAPAPNPTGITLAHASGSVGRGLSIAETAVNYNDLMMIIQAGSGKAGLVVTTPYRSISPENNPQASGFGDTTIATKAMLLDCELLQLTFEFKTTIPAGSARRGLGTGHVSLEPDILLALKLGPCTYLQSSISEWIPLGGDPGYQGAALRYNFAVNHTLWKPAPDLALVGTLEMDGMTFQGGEYTDPSAIQIIPLAPAPVTAASMYQLVPQRAATTYLSMGPGIRFVMCNKLDVGIGTQFHLTSERFADELYRFEFRYRF
jgi:hypothetical protein